MLNRYTTTSTASRISWLHCVVSRKKSFTSFSTNSRFATGSGCNSAPTVQRQKVPRTNRSAPSCALVYPVANSSRCSSAPSVTKAAAVVHRSSNGRGSKLCRRKPMIAFAAHSLGRNGDVGVRSTVMKSSRLRNPSGRASRSEEHTSELQSLAYLVCRLLLEKKKKKRTSE